MKLGGDEDASILQIFFLRVGPTPVLRFGWTLDFSTASIQKIINLLK